MSKGTRLVSSTFTAIIRPRPSAKPFVCSACSLRASTRAFSASQQPHSREQVDHAEGLEWIGTERWAQEQADTLEYEGFMRKTRVENADEIRQELCYAVTHAKRGMNKNTDAASSMQELPKAASIQDLASVSLREHDFKFFVVKRFMRTSGIRIPDAIISESQTADDLYKRIISIPKEESVFEKLMNSRAKTMKSGKTESQHRVQLASLPNVTIHQAKRSPVDKEKDIGRWKVIERELKQRNLF